MESGERPRRSRWPGWLWLGQVTWYGIFVLLCTWLIGGAWGVFGQLQLSYGRRLVDILKAVAFTLALLVAMGVFLYKYIMLVMNYDLHPSLTRLRFKLILPCSRRVASMPRGRRIAVLFGAIVGIVNLVLAWFAIWWMFDLRDAHYLGGTPLWMQGWAETTTWMLIVLYGWLVGTALVKIGDRRREPEEDEWEREGEDQDGHPAQPSRKLRGWLRLWNLEVYFP